jgi:fimbrial chaperone protein
MGWLVTTPSAKTWPERLRHTLWLCGLLLMVSQPALAFRLVPMREEFDPAGRGANRAFRVENDGNETVAIQISMLKREITLEGQELTTPADEEFIVYPPQFLLEPRQAQTIRVKWIGDANPARELAYRIVAEQLPVNFSKHPTGGAKVNLLVRYVGSIYIVPKTATPEISLESVRMRMNADLSRSLELTFSNTGTKHDVLRNLRLRLQSGGQTVELGPEQLEGVSGENLLSGSRRRFTIPWPVGLPDGRITATFDYHRRP